MWLLAENTDENVQTVFTFNLNVFKFNHTGCPIQFTPFPAFLVTNFIYICVNECISKSMQGLRKNLVQRVILAVLYYSLFNITKLNPSIFPNCKCISLVFNIKQFIKKQKLLYSQLKIINIPDGNIHKYLLGALQMILSKPKFNLLLNWTEFEVGLHSYCEVHHPPHTNYLLLLYYWPGSRGTCVYNYTVTDQFSHYVLRSTRQMFHTIWPAQN